MEVKHVDHEGSYMRVKHVRGWFAKMNIKNVNQQEEYLKKKKIWCQVSKIEVEHVKDKRLDIETKVHKLGLGGGGGWWNRD
jgi:hypothetical protein